MFDLHVFCLDMEIKFGIKKMMYKKPGKFDIRFYPVATVKKWFRAWDRLLIEAKYYDTLNGIIHTTRRVVPVEGAEFVECEKDAEQIMAKTVVDDIWESLMERIGGETDERSDKEEPV